jgi:AcrR family transcriptional regulator
VQAIAERSGVHASAIYRRWRSCHELIEDAIFGDLGNREITPTGDLEADLSRFVRSYLATFEGQLLRAAMPGLLAHRSAGKRTPQAWTHMSPRPNFNEILAAAPPCAVDPDVDPDDVFDLLLGAVLVRVLVPDDARRHPPRERTVELVLRLLTPRERGDARAAKEHSTPISRH